MTPVQGARSSQTPGFLSWPADVASRGFSYLASFWPPLQSTGPLQAQVVRLVREKDEVAQDRTRIQEEGEALREKIKTLMYEKSLLELQLETVKKERDTLQREVLRLQAPTEPDDWEQLLPETQQK